MLFFNFFGVSLKHSATVQEVNDITLISGSDDFCSGFVVL